MKISDPLKKKKKTTLKSLYMDLHQLAVSQKTYGQYGTVKIAFFCLSTLVFAFTSPEFYKNRKHPVFFYRTWHLYIPLLTCAQTMLFIDMLLSLEGIVTYDTFKIWYSAKLYACKFMLFFNDLHTSKTNLVTVVSTKSKCIFKTILILLKFDLHKKLD